MKIFRIACFSIFMIFLLTSTSLWAAKAQPRVQTLDQYSPIKINPTGKSMTLRTADSCSTNLGDEPHYFIYPWVVGDELYKAYQDPALTCDAPYPFTIHEIQFFFFYVDTIPGSVQLEVDIEEAINPGGCPTPGEMLALSPLYNFPMEQNLYLITIPLDTPIVINSPFFVGLYIGPYGSPEFSAVITDTFPAPCASYNDWGEGYVDLDTVRNDQTGEKIFLGRLLLYAIGTPGGSGGVQPAPDAQFINPISFQLIGNQVDLWANDAAGSEIIDQASFQYRRQDNWVDIGSDIADDPPLRDGVTNSGSGNGLTRTWFTTGLPEDDYDLKVIISDTVGRVDSSIIRVHVDPTPPFPKLISPTLGQNVCGGVTVSVTCPDEDIAFVTFERKSANADLQLPMHLFDQFLGGDVNGNPGDGNRASGGEFGDFCSGPAAAASVIKYWFNQGYIYIMSEGGNVLTDEQLMARLFSAMNIQEHFGSYDGEFVEGIRQYIITHGSEFELRTERSPSLNDLYTWVGNEEFAVMVGVSGNPGQWMTVTGWLPPLGSTDTFRFMNPLTGLIEELEVKDSAGRLWVMQNLEWREIDIIVGMIPYNWTVSRTAIGVDTFGGDGWGTLWNTDGLLEDSIYFFSTTLNDQTNNSFTTGTMVRYDCVFSLNPGDIDDDGSLTPADMVYLINFLYLGGPAPPVGVVAGDITCDGLVNLADVLFIYNYIFTGGPAPASCQ